MQGTNYRMVGCSAPTTGFITLLSSLDHSFGDTVHIVAQLSNLPTGLYTPATLPGILKALLLQYFDLFEASTTTVPPYQIINHQISLPPGTGHMNEQPYHYGHAQKAELE